MNPRNVNNQNGLWGNQCLRYQAMDYSSIPTYNSNTAYPLPLRNCTDTMPLINSKSVVPQGGQQSVEVIAQILQQPSYPSNGISQVAQQSIQPAGVIPQVAHQPTQPTEIMPQIIDQPTQSAKVIPQVVNQYTMSSYQNQEQVLQNQDNATSCNNQSNFSGTILEHTLRYGKDALPKNYSNGYLIQRSSLNSEVSTQPSGSSFISKSASPITRIMDQVSSVSKSHSNYPPTFDGDYAQEQNAVSALAPPFIGITPQEIVNGTSATGTADVAHCYGSAYKNNNVKTDTYCGSDCSNNETKTEYSGTKNKKAAKTENTTGRKRTRQTYTRHQTMTLEKAYLTSQYLTAFQRSAVAQELHLEEGQVKTWFQNRRMKDKRNGIEHKVDAPNVVNQACPLPTNETIPQIINPQNGAIAMISSSPATQTGNNLNNGVPAYRIPTHSYSYLNQIENSARQANNMPHEEPSYELQYNFMDLT